MSSPWLPVVDYFTRAVEQFAARVDIFRIQAEMQRRLMEQATLEATMTGTGGFSLTGTQILGSSISAPPQALPPLAEIHEATNGYYARTRNGSVVLGKTLSELLAALQGILAEEVLRQPTDGSAVVTGAWRAV